MKINLNEIPADGRAYDFNRQTGELNSILEDLIGKAGYQVDFYIRPMGNAYELKGTLSTTMSETCSQCGADLDLPVNLKINEILIDEPKDYRKSHSVHGNSSVDFLTDGPAVTTVSGNIFQAGDFVHEAIALAEPLYPVCGETTCKNREEVQKFLEGLGAEADQAVDPNGHPAFSVLKDLKL